MLNWFEQCFSCCNFIQNGSDTIYIVLCTVSDIDAFINAFITYFVTGFCICNTVKFIISVSESRADKDSAGLILICKADSVSPPLEIPLILSSDEITDCFFYKKVKNEKNM